MKYEWEILDESKRKLIVCYIGADWCRPCKEMSPVVDAVAEKFGNRIRVYKEEEGNRTSSIKVEGYPTIVFFKDGKNLGRIHGSKTEEALTEIIERALSL